MHSVAVPRISRWKRGKHTIYRLICSGEAGVLQLNLAQIFPPANDNFANAEAINSLPFHATVDNSAALFEPDEPQGCGFGFQSLWYTFTPAENMGVRLNTVGSIAPGNVSIYLASGPSIHRSNLPDLRNG